MIRARELCFGVVSVRALERLSQNATMKGSSRKAQHGHGGRTILDGSTCQNDSRSVCNLKKGVKNRL